MGKLTVVNSEDAMSGSAANGWTLKSLYELVREIDKRQTGDLMAADKRYEERYIGQLREVKTALDGQAESVRKAELSAEKRFDEFRREITEKLDDPYRWTQYRTRKGHWSSRGNRLRNLRLRDRRGPLA